MRKSLLILLGFLGCLLFAGGGEACVAREVVPAAQLCVDRASDNEWLCEREYNSDLSLPRVCGETAVPPAVRSVTPDVVRTAEARAAAAFHAGGISQETSYNKPFDPVAGPYAVDYYVYRLRRLLI